MSPAAASPWSHRRCWDSGRRNLVDTEPEIVRHLGFFEVSFRRTHSAGDHSAR
jgi:hypothetical protein